VRFARAEQLWEQLAYADNRLQTYEEYTLKFEHLTANIKTKQQQWRRCR